MARSWNLLAATAAALVAAAGFVSAAAAEQAGAGLRGSAAVVAATGADPPTQVHIMYAGNPTGTGMIVSYMTQGTTATSTVRYGTSPTLLNSTATGFQTSYLVTWHHHIRLQGLTPNTRYYYSCGDATAGYSSVYSFVTANPQPTYPWSVAVFGDAGIPGAEEVIGDLQRVLPNISFTLHIGDISYAVSSSPIHSAAWSIGLHGRAGLLACRSANLLASATRLMSLACHQHQPFLCVRVVAG